MSDDAGSFEEPGAFWIESKTTPAGAGVIVFLIVQRRVNRHHPLSIVSCGGGSSPTGASQAPPGTASLEASPSLAASYGSAKSTWNGTTVAEILANPNAFLRQPVELHGSATERFSTGELLFTDATGSIPADFSAAGSAPELNVSMIVTGTVAAGLVGDTPSRSSWLRGRRLPLSTVKTSPMPGRGSPIPVIPSGTSPGCSSATAECPRERRF